MVRFDTVTLLILISPQTISSPFWLRIMIHIRFSSPVALQLRAPPQSKRKSPCAQIISL